MNITFDKRGADITSKRAAVQRVAKYRTLAARPQSRTFETVAALSVAVVFLFVLFA